jgi:hypothetical protein
MVDGRTDKAMLGGNKRPPLSPRLTPPYTHRSSLSMMRSPTITLTLDKMRSLIVGI